MVKNTLKLILLIIGAFFLQLIWPTAAVYPFFKFDAILMLVILGVMFLEPRGALASALVLGIIMDLLSGAVFLQSLVYLIVSMAGINILEGLAGNTEQKYFLLLAIASVIEITVQALAGTLFWGTKTAFAFWFFDGISLLVGNVVLALVAYFIFEEYQRNSYRMKRYNPLIKQI